MIKMLFKLVSAVALALSNACDQFRTRSGGNSFEIFGGGGTNFMASAERGPILRSSEAPLKPANFQHMRHTFLHKTVIKFGQHNLTENA